MSIDHETTEATNSQTPATFTSLDRKAEDARWERRHRELWAVENSRRRTRPVNVTVH